VRAATAILLFLPAATFCHPCASCHPKEVAGYARTPMGMSLRSPIAEPDGSLEHARSGTRFLIRSNRSGLFQRMQHDGENSDYRIDYVIGSGTHASCYLARVGDHLFESPVCYYPGRGYDMAPGFEDSPAPGFTRPITIECLLCHSGKPLPVGGSLNRYESPAFDEEAISCERCHGDSSAHLRRPVRGSIVNPARLPSAQRNSVCERCHLAGVIRVLNPGKSFADFRPGQILEDVFTTYVAAKPAGGTPLRVVSQSEELAQSRCAVESHGQLWCASCHDSHNATATASTYREKCLSCHKTALAASHPPRTSNCLPCHMPRLEARDGGHTAFTDHRIARRPRVQDHSIVALPESLAAWREPAPQFRLRNMALAYNTAGLRSSSPASIEKSFPMLIEVQKTFPDDPDVLMAIGTVLENRKDFLGAARMFDRVIDLRPNDPAAEDSAATAYLSAGDKESAIRHFERALALDALLLPDIESLLGIYREAGDGAKEDTLMRRVREAMQTGPGRTVPPRH
jgi:hypothetical protein